MHIRSFVHFTHAICKMLFSYGIYSQYFVRRKMRVSDVKNYGTFDTTVAFADAIPLWLQKHSENVKVLSLCYAAAFCKKCELIYDHKVFFLRIIPGNLWEETLCNEPHIIHNSFGVTFLSHIPCAITLQECELHPCLNEVVSQNYF